MMANFLAKHMKNTQTSHDIKKDNSYLLVEENGSL